MSGFLLAIVVAVLGMAGSALWFGVRRRRSIEIELGIHALANMKWRECIAVLLETLRQEGYRLSADATAVGDGGSEFLLSRDDEKVLLGYKHGTSYRLNEANVRDFAYAVKQRGASSGILLTLGQADQSAMSVARTSDIDLIDGNALWPKVREFIQPQMLARVQENAAAETRKGMWIGGVASVLAGAAIYLIFNSGLMQKAVDTPILVADDATASPSAAGKARAVATGSDADMLRQLNVTAKAMEAVAKLTPGQLAARRAAAAKNVSLISQVDLASWSAPRTMLITLNQTDGRDKVLVDEVCRILTQYEEMRYTRIQLEAPATTRTPVRWRLCS